MSTLRSVRWLCSILVYFTAITYGTGIFVVRPARPLLVVPVLTGGVLLSHAVATTQLDAVGDATMWLWTVVLALVGGGLVAEEFVHRDIPPIVDIPVARTFGTLGLIAALITAYVRNVQRAKQGETRSGLPP